MHGISRVCRALRAVQRPCTFAHCFGRVYSYVTTRSALTPVARRMTDI
jgi:hypothetical protein